MNISKLIIVGLILAFLYIMYNNGGIALGSGLFSNLSKFQQVMSSESVDNFQTNTTVTGYSEPVVYPTVQVVKWVKMENPCINGTIHIRYYYEDGSMSEQNGGNC